MATEYVEYNGQYTGEQIDSAIAKVGNLKTVATSGSYNDLTNKPTIPDAANNATLTIKKNGTAVGTFTANADTNVDINITVPTTASDVSALPSSTKYAGASTAGGAATSAAKLNTNAGNATNPVYFSSGVPVACTHSLEKSVPSNAVFTDTTYESKSAASGGTAVSLVTTGEKYTWNNKQDTISDLSTIRSGAALGATAVQPETGKGLSTNDYTDADKTAVGTIGDKVDKVSGKGLSTNDFTNAYKTKVDNIHGLEPNIASSTTIKDYVDALSKGHYTSFIMFNSVPSDSPTPSTNAFVEIIVYSATTSMVRLTPVGTTADNKFFVLTKSGGTWRSWYKYEGTAAT